MKFYTYLLWGMLVALLLEGGCKENPVQPVTSPSHITGSVLDSVNNGIAGAIITDQGDLKAKDTSKTDGTFSLNLGVLSSQYNTSLFTNAQGYFTDTTAVKVEIGKDQSVTIHLRRNPGVPTASGKSGRATSIQLKSITSKIIALRGTGGNDNSKLTFLVVDSSNNAVGLNQCWVKFSVNASHPSGEFVKPDSIQTDNLGQVSTTVFSGTKPNVLQVNASTRGDTVKASPVFLTEGTGLADSSHVSIAATVFNIAGRVFSNLSTTITLTVGDQFGNPVVDGTAATFVTDGGIIAPSAFTTNGLATVDLRSGGGNPPLSGFVTVTAETKGDTSIIRGDSLIIRKIQILFSGHTQPPTLDSTALNFQVPNGGVNYFDFTVADDRGNPLVAGSKVTVTVKASDTLQPDLELLNDTKTYKDVKSQSETHFHVGVHDKKAGGASGIITFGIEITSPNDDYSNSNWFQGYVGAGGGGSIGVPASISLADSTVHHLYLSETQLPDTSTRLTFLVKDANGTPLNATRKALVNFTLVHAPSGTHIYPSQDSTNASGYVSVRVASGNTPGSAQVRASIPAQLISATSLPILIQGGLPDSTKIFLDIKKNIFNKRGSTPVATLTMNLSDIFGNAPAPLAIQFSTSRGSIGVSSVTDLLGNASIPLYGGSSGFGTISAFVPVHGGDTVTRTISFLLSGPPQITFSDPTVVNISTNALQYPLADGAFLPIDFRIWDNNNNPISSGNAIKITISGAAAPDMEVDGNVDVPTLPDDTTAAQTKFQFTIKDNKPGGGLYGNFTVTITVTGESGSITKTLTGVLLPFVSGYGSSIQLLSGSPSATTISVKGTGATETSTLSFVVKDSLGNPVSAARPATVLFSIVGGPGGGEFPSPTSAITDANGKVTTTINAGTKAGVMQVVATTTISGVTITSAPVPLTIASGLADPAHFTVWTDKLNWPGWVSQGIPIGNVQVQIGDMYGNPVQPNTAVYFTATGGIVTSSAFTDPTGHIPPPYAIVYGGNPIPLHGIDIIIVSTMGQGGVTIKDTVATVYSGAPKVTVASTNLGTIAIGGSLQVNYTVADSNRNPLASGNTISVTAGGTAGALAQLSGNTSVTTTDTKDTNTTKYQFMVTNNVPAGGTGGNFTVTIAVNGPNGTTTKTLTGTLASPVPTISAPTQIAISNVSSSLIAARGTGGVSSSDLTFQVLDATGRPIGVAQQDTVYFSLSDTTGGAYLIPTWAISDNNGQASTRLYAGIKFGTPSITARMKTILSQPVLVRISGPYLTNFNVTLSAMNLPGLSQIGSTVGTLSVQVGDSLGNPVLAGTTVRFTTSGGMVDPSAVTAGDGSASVRLYGGATPNEPSLGGIGWGYVTAKTQGDNGTVLQRKVPFLFSGTPIVTTLNVPSSDTIVIYDAGYVDIDYKVADANRNPLAAGNTVSVSMSGAAASQISLSNYYNFTTSGTTDTNATLFRVRFSDANPGGGTGGNFDIAINVNGANGTYTKRFHGTLLAPQSIVYTSPSAKLPAQIAFLSVTSSDIYVSGVGALENSVLSYEVRDSLGIPIEKNPRAFATFDLQFFPNTFTNTGTPPRLIPTSDSTDDNARLRVSINSGTQAGVIQVVARIDLGGGKFIVSQPVRISIHAGFPDQRHFTVGAERINFPGLDRDFVTETITAQVVDKYSNPVLPGTSVYFNSTHGSVGTGTSKQGTGLTDLDGFVQQILYSGNPFPEGNDTLAAGRGFTYLYARTLGADSATVMDSIKILWTGAPVITKTGGSATVTVPNGGTDGPWSFTITDRFGHPLSGGTVITVTCGDATINGNANVTLPDTQVGGSGITDFVVTASDSDPTDGQPPKPAILMVTVNHPVYGVYTLVLATGSTD